MFNGKYWITNWFQYNSKEEIDWERVEEFCKKKRYSKYGFMYGTKSRNLISDNNRTIVGNLEG